MSSLPPEAVDPARYDLGAIRLRLRPDLELRRQSFAGAECVIVEDPARSRFFRLGETEAAFLSLLDGQTSICDAVAETAGVSGGDALTELEAAALCRWLVEQELATTPQSRDAGRLIAAAELDRKRRRRERINPVTLKIPLGNPDAIMKVTARLFGWMLGPLGWVVSALLVAAAAVVLFTQWDRLTAEPPVLSIGNGLWLLITAVVLKVLHEFGHGVACKRGGGEVRDCGILLLLFVPLPYVDVTSSWRFGSKWSRCGVAAAGVAVELTLAAAAILVWSQSADPLVRFHALNVALVAGVVTVLFNANPLMRFDGYFILSDLLELPNLGGHGQQWLQSVARRAFFGQPSPSPTWPEGRAPLVRMYGVAAFLWRIVICVSLTLAAESLFHGAGIVVAAAAVVMWGVLPVARLVRSFIKPGPVRPINRVHFAAVAAALSAVAFGVSQITWASRLRLPAVVEYAPLTTVRTLAGGFVETVHVRSGQSVTSGQPLITLRNEWLDARVEQLRLSIEESRLRTTRFHQSQQLAAEAVEWDNRLALQTRLRELTTQQDALRITARADGRVLTVHPDRLLGRWTAPGTPLLELAPAGGPAVRFYASQSVVDAARDFAGRPVRLRLDGVIDPIVATIDSVEPRATRALKSPKLTAVAGGPLDVQRQSDDQTDLKADQWRLTEPHFVGRLALPAESLAPVGVGQTGHVDLLRPPRRVGTILRTAARHYWDNRLTRR